MLCILTIRVIIQARVMRLKGNDLDGIELELEATDGSIMTCRPPTDRSTDRATDRSIDRPNRIKSVELW